MREGEDGGFGGYVCGEGDYGAGDVGAVERGYGLEFFFGAAYDVDFCAVDGEGLGCH